MDSALPKGIWIAIVIAMAMAMGAMHYALKDGISGGDSVSAAPAAVADDSSVGRLSRQPVQVVLDPGHGGSDGGTVVFSLMEKELALDISMRVRRELARRKIRAVMTRDDDVDVELVERVAFGRKYPGAPFVSIHLNRFHKPTVSGMEIYVFDGAPVPAPTTSGHRSASGGGDLQWLSGSEDDGKSFYDRRSTTLANHILDAATSDNDLNHRGVRQRKLFVVKNAAPPSVLVECGFLSNPQDARRFSKAAFREQVAKGIASGIEDYLNGVANEPTYGFRRTSKLGNGVLTIK